MEGEREKHLNKLLDKTDQSSRLMKRTQNITRNEAIIANLMICGDFYIYFGQEKKYKQSPSSKTALKL